MDEQERYREAKKRVEELKGFYIHVAMYLLVNAALVVINLVTSPEYLWFIWTLLGWGVGVAAHAIAVFGIPGMFGPDWEERKIQEYMKRSEDQDQHDRRL